MNLISSLASGRAINFGNALLAGQAFGIGVWMYHFTVWNYLALSFSHDERRKLILVYRVVTFNINLSLR